LFAQIKAERNVVIVSSSLIVPLFVCLGYQGCCIILASSRVYIVYIRLRRKGFVCITSVLVADVFRGVVDKEFIGVCTSLSLLQSRDDGNNAARRQDLFLSLKHYIIYTQRLILDHMPGSRRDFLLPS
jgi:hypothetical protein